MKTYTIRMAVFATVAALATTGAAFAGQTQAELERALRQSADPEGSLGWPGREALETGNVPSEGGTLETGGGPSGTVPTVEIGGLVYRLGIDTP